MSGEKNVREGEMEWNHMSINIVDNVYALLMHIREMIRHMQQTCPHYHIMNHVIKYLYLSTSEFSINFHVLLQIMKCHRMNSH